MILAVDVGKARVGLAVAAQNSELVLPLDAVARHVAVAEISKMVIERQISTIYVGNPINLKGESTLSTEDAVAFAMQLQELAPVFLVDERLTTALVLNHAKGATRPSQVDSLSAAEILKLVISNPACAKEIDG